MYRNNKENTKHQIPITITIIMKLHNIQGQRHRNVGEGLAVQNAGSHRPTHYK